MVDTVINVEELGKQYFIDHQRAKGDDLRHAIQAALQAPFRRQQWRGVRKIKEEFWALRDVSFSINQGEAVGIVGRNGAGKSTLLKLLSRITEPTTGKIRYKGRVSSLLEVGTGFHPELTGRENIFLNAAILGMRRSDIARRFDEIVAFSEVEQFLDTPVKRYSSGMYVRLAFGVAAHLEPDILLVDEVLAVGDAAFQKKCLGKMGNVVQEGRTVLFVSHNMAAIASLCTRALLIEGGRLELSSSPQTVIEKYLSKSRANAGVSLLERKDRKGNGRLRFTGVSILNDRMESIETVTSGQNISIVLDYDIHDSNTLHNAVVQIKFSGILGQPLFACLSRSSLRESFTLSPGARLLCKIPRLPLVPGMYTYTLWCTIGGTLEDYVSEAGKVTVAEGDYFGTGNLPSRDVGDFLVEHTWSAR
ncbi:MAG TPA: ABC transporter ATP-binding protein [Candidatus Saccharimonadales bacterium]|nr:ABC transporter ATP-binding protein [Candidatus Saccharimonadales bacterium]